MSQFTLSRDTDWSDLMQFISDNRETFDYSRKDLNTISKNECFGLVALQVKEYLEDEGLSLDDIDLSHYSNDMRKNALEDVVARAFRTYLSGEYNPAEVHEFVEEAKASCGIADRRPSFIDCIKEEDLSMSLNKIVVPTMKHFGDDRVPDALEVETPFSIGQELDFEYDIHNKMQRAPSFGGWTTFSGSKDIGHFKISGIFANMLISPPKTMVEVESLDERFNRIYPTQKTMVIEQESLLKRIRMQKPALDDTIQSASIRTGDSHASPDTPVKTPNPER